MSKSSVLGYCVEMDSAALGADYPCDANNALYYANNVHHLFDMSTQVRVNWVATSLSNCPIKATGTVTAHWFSYIFPVSISAYGGYPEDLVIRIGGAVDAGSCFLSAYVVPATWPQSSQDHDKYIAKLTGPTSSVAGEWIIQGRIGDQYDDSTPGYIRESIITTPVYTEYDSSRQRAEIALVRLSIYGYGGGGGESAGYIAGVSVREFHYQS